MRARAGLSHTWREFRQKAHLDTHFRFGFRLHLPTPQTLSSIFSVVPRRLRMHLGNIVRSHLMKSPYSSSEERICPNSSEILWTDLRRKRLTCVLGCVRVCVNVRRTHWWCERNVSIYNYAYDGRYVTFSLYTNMITARTHAYKRGRY